MNTRDNLGFLTLTITGPLRSVGLQTRIVNREIWRVVSGLQTSTTVNDKLCDNYRLSGRRV